MNICEECIAYKIHHDMAEPMICPQCGQKKLIWHQSDYGTFFAECDQCSNKIAVDLNTPCEKDDSFHRMYRLVIKAQKSVPDKRAILDMAKAFGVNSVEMYDMLAHGWTVEADYNDLFDYTAYLDENGLEYQIDGYEDPRVKYQYYSSCRYPYSKMRIYLDQKH